MEYDVDLIPLMAFTNGCLGDYFWNQEWWVCIGHHRWAKLAPGQRAHNRIY